MGKILASYLFPHPPIIIPEIGGGREKDASKTIESCRNAVSEIAKNKPATIIVLTPHAHSFNDCICVWGGKSLKGDLSNFAVEKRFDFKNNIQLVKKILRYTEEASLPLAELDDELEKKYNMKFKLDHGTSVPLYFINEGYKDFKIVQISMNSIGNKSLQDIAKCVSKAVDELDEDVVIIGSGDLSHRLTLNSPYGYSERGEEFDKLVVDSIQNNDINSLLNMESEFIKEAGECGLCSFISMMSAMDGFEVKPELYSYEGPFGVGYAVAKFDIKH